MSTNKHTEQSPCQPPFYAVAISLSRELRSFSNASDRITKWYTTRWYLIVLWRFYSLLSEFYSINSEIYYDVSHHHFLPKPTDFYRTATSAARFKCCINSTSRAQGDNEKKTPDLLLVETEADLYQITELLTDEFRQLPKLAIFRPDQLNRNQIYQAGFHDYLLHPLLKQEVQYRIISSIEQSSAASSGVTSYTHPHLHAVTTFLPGLFRQSLPTKIDHQQQLIQKACAYMHANLAKRLTLALVAKETGISRTKLAALFQSRLNTTVFEWLRQQRMLQAESLLLQSNLQIQQIAYAVGYDNPANFATCYRQHFQRSPSASRKKGR